MNYAKTPDEIRLDLLDELAESFKTAAQTENESLGWVKPEEIPGLWRAYHHTRAIAHDLGIHLTSCSEGRRVGDAKRHWNDEDVSCTCTGPSHAPNCPQWVLPY